MRVAVITMTRDRLDYTRHCFNTLHENAGIPFEHYVLDQGSQDGSRAWLVREYEEGPLTGLVLEPENIGILRGVNKLLDLIGEQDVIVKFDNDCELTQPNTLRDVCRLVMESGALLSPRILGLRNPPASQGTFMIGDEEILDIPQIGGIFLAAPGSVYQSFRCDETSSLDDDVQFCWWYRGQGGRCGYVKRLEAWHYETTDGQWARYPDYFERRVLEGGRAW